MAKTRERRKESKTITGKSRSVQDHEAESGYPGAGTAAAAVELLISGSRRQIRLLPVCCLFPSLQKSPLVVWKTVRLSQSTHCSTRLGTYIKSEPGAARCCWQNIFQDFPDREDFCLLSLASLGCVAGRVDCRGTIAPQRWALLFSEIHCSPTQSRSRLALSLCDGRIYYLARAGRGSDLEATQDDDCGSPRRGFLVRRMLHDGVFTALVSVVWHLVHWALHLAYGVWPQRWSFIELAKQTERLSGRIDGWHYSLLVRRVSCRALTSCNWKRYSKYAKLEGTNDKLTNDSFHQHKTVSHRKEVISFSRALVPIQPAVCSFSSISGLNLSEINSYHAWHVYRTCFACRHHMLDRFPSENAAKTKLIDILREASENPFVSILVHPFYRAAYCEWQAGDK